MPFHVSMPLEEGISKSTFSLCSKSIALGKVLLHSNVLLIYMLWFYTFAMGVIISKIMFFQCNVKDHVHLQYLLITSPALLWSSLLWHRKLSLFPLLSQSFPCVVIYNAYYSVTAAYMHTCTEILHKFSSLNQFSIPFQHPTVPSCWTTTHHSSGKVPLPFPKTRETKKFTEIRNTIS